MLLEIGNFNKFNICSLKGVDDEKDSKKHGMVNFFFFSDVFNSNTG